MNDVTHGMKIIEPQQENFHVYFKDRGWEFAVPEALLKYPERLSHRLMYQTYVRAIRPSSFEIVQHSPHKWETLVRWIRLKPSSDVQLMSCGIFIIAIGDGDLQSHIFLGLPPLQPRSVMKSEGASIMSG